MFDLGDLEGELVLGLERGCFGLVPTGAVVLGADDATGEGVLVVEENGVLGGLILASGLEDLGVGVVGGG